MTTLWLKDGALVLSGGAAVLCADCPCGGATCCFDDAIAETLPVVVNGSVAQVTCADCPDPPTIGDAVYQGGSSCQWKSPAYGGGECGLPAATINFEAASDTECTITASIAIAFDSGPGGACGTICETANYIGTFLSSDPGPWELAYDSGFAVVCDFSGTTLTIG